MTVEDWDSVNRFFSKRLSKQLIFNHIYPYTFECQPGYFLDDIKSYFLGYEKVLKIYQEDYYFYIFLSNNQMQEVNKLEDHFSL